MCVLLSAMYHHHLSGCVVLHKSVGLGGYACLMLTVHGACCISLCSVHTQTALSLCVTICLLCLRHRALRLCTALLPHCIAPVSPRHNLELSRVAHSAHCCTVWIAPVLLAYAAADCELQTQPGSCCLPSPPPCPGCHANAECCISLFSRCQCSQLHLSPTQKSRLAGGVEKGGGDSEIVVKNSLSSLLLGFI